MAHTHHHHYTGKWQKFGATLSIACSIHCLLTPFVIAFLPAAGGSLLSNPWLERGLLALCFVLAGLSLYNDYRKLHNSTVPMLILAVGLIIVLFKELFPESETILAIFIGLTVFSAYIINWRRSRQYLSACTHE